MLQLFVLWWLSADYLHTSFTVLYFINYLNIVVFIVIVVYIIIRTFEITFLKNIWTIAFYELDSKIESSLKLGFQQLYHLEWKVYVKNTDLGMGISYFTLCYNLQTIIFFTLIFNDLFRRFIETMCYFNF